MNFLDFIFPKRCVGCGRIGRYFCDRCSSIIRIIEANETICPVCEKPAMDGRTHPRCSSKHAIDGLTSFFHYDGVVRKAIKAIKYRYVSDLTQEFVDRIPVSFFISLSQFLPPKHLSSLLLPIPLHPTRERFRGFNQADVLGRALAKRVKLPVETTILQRTQKTVPQVDMKDREKRLRNMIGVFALSGSFDKTMRTSGNIKNRTVGVILFDDVFTTGATMRSAAAVLKRAGIPYVWGITMAR